MGLFSKKKTTVYAATQKLLSDTPNTGKDAVLNAVLKGRDIAPDIVAAYMYGASSKLDRLYRYGQSDYYLGLPDSKYARLSTFAYRSERAITTELGMPVTLVSSVLDYPDPMYWVMNYLIDVRGYSESTDTITTPPLWLPASAFNITVVGTAFSGSSIKVMYDYDYIESGKIKSGSSNEYYNVGETVNPTGYYYQASYIATEGSNNVRYWHYNSSLSTYAYLPKPVSTELDSPYYPIIPIRENNQDMLVSDGSTGYLNRRKALDILGLTTSSLSTAINGTAEEPNTSLGDLDHAYVVLGLEVTEEDEDCAKYLHEYFNELGSLNEDAYNTFNAYTAVKASVSSVTPINNIEIKDSKYNISLSFNYIRSSVKQGVIAKVGKVTKQIVLTDEINLWGIVTIDNNSLVLRKQLDSDTYSEVVVHGLKHTNYVYGSHSVTTSLKQAVNSTTTSPNENFIIPINRATIKRMKVSEANTVYYKSLQIVFLSYNVTKLKWYQTSAFQILIIIVAIAITIFTAGSGSSIGVAIVSAVGATGTTALVLAVAIDLIIMQAVGMIFTYVAQYFSPELALTIAVIAAAVTYGVSAGESVNALADTASLLESQVTTATTTATAAAEASATSALSLAGFIDSYGASMLSSLTSLPTAAINAQMEDMQESYQNFQENYEETMADLEKQNEELDRDTAVQIDPLSLAYDYQSQSYEKVEEYYYRKIHVGNIGVLVFDTIANYVESIVTLPTVGTELSPEIFI